MLVLRAYGKNLPPNDIARIITLLKQGDVGILPTDSVYTLACSLNSAKGIERLCKLVNKKPSQSHLSIICSDFEMISSYTLPFSTATFRLMKTSLPGPFTFIMKADVKKFKGYENRRQTIGVRIPDEDFLIDLVKELGQPLICSSLHSEDELKDYFTDPEEIELHFLHKADFFVEDGLGGTSPSTIVDCTSETPQVIRQGKGLLP
jgi:tRNA threonylcarbamoyl adenosine modification protein (Sua5/YciO/YrdC/YwlC family)